MDFLMNSKVTIVAFGLYVVIGYFLFTMYPDDEDLNEQPLERDRPSYTGYKPKLSISDEIILEAGKEVVNNGFVII